MHKLSKVPEEAEYRYDFTSKALENMPRNIPILGVCWGLQFLNVYFGGDLVQHMENSQEHYKKRRFSALKGSMLEEAIGSEILGNCYHHQSIGKLAKGIKVTGIDDFSKEPHALEYTEEGRQIMSVLWHPESTHEDETRENLYDKSIQLSKYFINKCKEFKKTKN